MFKSIISLCSLIFTACGAPTSARKEPPRPAPTIVGDESLIKYAKQFQQDCHVYLSAKDCRIPHKITMKYFPAEEEPDKRGYAELSGYDNNIHIANVRISDYLASAAFKDALLVTVYHELFHAWFSLEHDDTSRGIMNSVGYFVDDVIIVENFDTYVEKEFKRVRNK